MMKKNYKIKILSAVPREYEYQIKNGSLSSVSRTPHCEEIFVEAEGGTGCRETLVKAVWKEGGFTFCPTQVREECPIFSSRLQIAVVPASDRRNYFEIAEQIKRNKKPTDRERTEAETPFTYARAKKLEWHRCPTFLAVFGNVNLWEAGFRGFPIEEKQHVDLYDYFIPRKNWDRVDFGADAQRVVYRYLLGRGMGCRCRLKRRNLKGYLPALTASLRENDIEYRVLAFCDSKEEQIEKDTGTFYLEADYRSAGHVLTDAQETARREYEKNGGGRDTLLRVKLSAENTADTPRFAYFRLPHINTQVMAENEQVNQRFENGTGVYGDKIYMLSSFKDEKGTPEGLECAFFLPPKKKTEIFLLLFHSPVSREEADRYSPSDFEIRLREASAYWESALGPLSRWHLPEKLIDESVKTGYLHLLESCYGRKEDGVFAPAAGVYSPIGSESSPIVQFMDSVGDLSFAGRNLDYFFAKQHPDGFIQNMTGYMLENGMVLYTAGLHYAYSKDKEWLLKNQTAILSAAAYLERWIERNKCEKSGGYGMIDGQVADPADTFRSYALNACAYAGLKNAAALLKECENVYAEKLAFLAEELRKNIRAAFKESEVNAPLVPLKSGEWVPAVPPWAEGRGAVSLHLDGEICVTHASHVLKDSLLSLPFLVYYGVYDLKSRESNDIIDYITDSYLDYNTAYSQPYYSLVPLLNLFRGERNCFLKEYYTALSTLADRETHSFWEHYFLATPHKTHEQAWFLMRTRFMLYYEEGDALKLLYGIPDEWRVRGKRIALKDARCYFGKFSLDVFFGEKSTEISFECDFEDQRTFIQLSEGERELAVRKGKNHYSIGR